METSGERIADEYLSDLRSTRVIENPYPYYAALRAAAPVLYAPANDIWVVSSYDACISVLKDASTFRAIDALWPRPDHAGAGAVQLAAHASRPPSSEDGESHIEPAATRLTPQQFAVYRGLLGAQRSSADWLSLDTLVRNVIDAFAGDGHVEAIGQFVRPLATELIGAYFGLPREIWFDFFDAWYERIRPSVDPRRRARQDVLNPLGSLPVRQAALHAVIVSRLADRRVHSQPDVLGVIADAYAGTDGIDLQALARLLAKVAPNAVVTTADFLGNALWLILRAPGVAVQLRVDPSLIPNAIEEALRLESPMQAQYFQTQTATRLGGVTLPSEAKLLVLLGSANRDPEVFLDPERFDPRRERVRAHLAFSYGAGACIGAPLVRRVGEAALKGMLTRLPGLRLQADQDFVHFSNWFNRGLSRLELDFDSRCT